MIDKEGREVVFDAIKIGMASPEQIRAWSHGEVKKAETINYRTLKPEQSGLFCERIFGPTKDWECHCGKYKKIRYKGKVCDKCGVEVTRAKVRRERMGHIELATPVSHIWYFKGIPSRMGLLLEITPKQLEKVLYFAEYIVTDPGDVGEITRGELLTERKYRDLREKYDDDFDAGMGAEAIQKLLCTVGLDDVQSRRKLKLLEYRKERELTESEEKELEGLNGLEPLSAMLHEQLRKSSGQKKAKIVKRLEVVDAFRLSGNKPEWMILNVLPVIPPDLRPMVRLDGGRFAHSDLNDLYRRVINRNNRLQRLISLNAPELIVRNEKRMLQEAVDSLIDNGRRGRAVTGANNRSLKSLSDLLKGKQGRFRLNLLGKRVDYSGRSVIVVGPELKIYQCGVPKEMAVELFRPFIMKKLVQDATATNIKSAKKMVDKGVTEVWDALDVIIKDHPVMLNRAPTLHRLGIQAFEPVLVDGRALKLHPLNCTAFNADFDGDQMAIHVPLSAEAQAEARILMLSANNLLRPQDGGPVTVPTQDMVLGSYYLTMDRMGHDELGAGEIFCQDAGSTTLLRSGEKVSADDFLAAKKLVLAAKSAAELAAGERQKAEKAAEDARSSSDPADQRRAEAAGEAARKAEAAEAEARAAAGIPDGDDRFQLPVYRPIHCYTGEDEALVAYHERVIGAHCPILVRRRLRLEDGAEYVRVVEVTPGQIIFNQNLPQDLGFVDRRDPAHVCDYEITFTCGKKQLGEIVDRTIQKHGFTRAAEVLDAIKATGYKYSTQAAITVSIADMSIPPRKKELVRDAEQKVLAIEGQYKDGFMTDQERYREVIKVWEKATDDVSDALQENLDRYNPIYMMADSGARGSMKQIRQLAGMRGLIANTAGRTIEIPIKANYREGLTALEYFISSRGARKGLADTALRTADSGYLTRRMVDVSQEVIIREEDCHVKHGILVSEISENGQVIEKFEDRLRGRFLVDDVLDTETDRVLIPARRMLTKDDAKILQSRKWVQHNFREGDECRYDPEEEGTQPTVMIRTVLTCKAHRGVCARCYGMNLATTQPVGLGEAVGIIAAQSIGEPGTQLTMRTFHTGGLAGGDITQGLPRVEELFEARKPKRPAQMTEIDGTLQFEDTGRSQLKIHVIGSNGETAEYDVPHTGLLVRDGEFVPRGTQLSYGALNPHDVLRIRGEDAVYNYLIQEVLRVYRQQGVDINDKHIEVIVRQMMRKVRLEKAGDTDLLEGSMVNVLDLDEANAKIEQRTAEGEVREDGSPLEKAEGTQLLMGITKASLATESFLSAASFQETTKVLTDAAIKGKMDHLEGLKENVIIGKLIPAGTGLDRYRELAEELVPGYVESPSDKNPDFLTDLNRLEGEDNASDGGMEETRRQNRRGQRGDEWQQEKIKTSVLGFPVDMGCMDAEDMDDVPWNATEEDSGAPQVK